MRELLNFVSTARQAEQLNRLAGESLVLPKSNDASVSGEWQSPDGSTSASAPEAWRVGVYRYTSTPSTPPTATAVNVDPRESDLTTADIALLRHETADNAAPSSAPSTASTSDQHFARLLLASAVILVLLELAVAWFFGRGWT
jgi:hypothetical protein